MFSIELTRTKSKFLCVASCFYKSLKTNKDSRI